MIRPSGPFEVVGADCAGSMWVAPGSPLDDLRAAQILAAELHAQWKGQRCYMVHDLDNPELGDLSGWEEE